MALFYLPDVLGGNRTLPEAEAQHGLKVLRLRTADLIEVTDGLGNAWQARLLNDNFKKCTIELLAPLPVQQMRSKPVCLAVAPTKNLDRMEWLVEKAVEIGCDEIRFLLCRHSERKEIKLDRLEKVAINAMKQSGQLQLLRLQPMISFSQFIETANPEKTAMAHLSKTSPQQSLTALYAHRPALEWVIVGPEGDFAPEEILLAEIRGVQPVLLGRSRLRTETAALVACTTLNLLSI